jgi:hypothetical protein
MENFCRAMGCDIRSLDACYTSRPKMYHYQGSVFCERHYLEASHSNRPDPSHLIWDFERGCSGMFPHATSSAAAFGMLVRHRAA